MKGKSIPFSASQSKSYIVAKSQIGRRQSALLQNCLKGKDFFVLLQNIVLVCLIFYSL